jgi:excisionase family DNA binding protein
MPQKQRPMAPQRPGGLLDRDGLIDSDELAEYLGLPISTLDQWASCGGGPVYHKVGRHRRYAPSDVRAWLANSRRDDTYAEPTWSSSPTGTSLASLTPRP